MMISKTAFVFCVNAALKRRDAGLSKVSPNIAYEDKTEMWNTSVFYSIELLPLFAIL